MIWFVMVGLFGAFGLLCAGWVLFGGWLTACRGEAVALHCPTGGTEAVLRRYLWLRNLGLVRGKLLVIEADLPQQRQKEIADQWTCIEFLTLEQYLLRLGQER